MIIELYKLGMTATKIGKEYEIANPPINRGKEIKINDEEVITVN